MGAAPTPTVATTVFVAVAIAPGSPSASGPPTSKDQCKKDGWRTFTVPRIFKNQGDCVSFVETGR